MKILARPAIGRMIVALGTLNLNTEEDAADFADDFFRLSLLRDD